MVRIDRITIRQPIEVDSQAALKNLRSLIAGILRIDPDEIHMTSTDFDVKYKTRHEQDKDDSTDASQAGVGIEVAKYIG